MKTILTLACLLLSLSARAALDPVTDAADRRDPKAEALQRAAHAHMPKRRALAARAYGQIMSPLGIDPLFQIAADRFPFVRAEAAFALGQLGWVADAAGGRESEIQSKLSELLRDKIPEVRLAAIVALGKIGGAKTAALVEPSLAAKEPELRAAAVTALFRARLIQKFRDPEHPPAALPDELRARLEKLAGDQDPSVRLSVAFFFARNSEPDLEATMAKLTREKDLWTRMFAVMALAKMKATHSASELERAAREPEYFVRVAAVGALLAAGESLGSREFLLHDKSFHVRAAAAAGLDGVKKPEELRLLNQLFETDLSPTVRAEAVKGIAKTKGSELLPWLEKIKSLPDWQLREAAAQSSVPLEAGAREKFLLSLLADANKNVKSAALEALFAIPSPVAFQHLKLSLESPELSERSTAVGALKDRKESGTVELAWKTYAASLDQKWTEMREDLLEIFSKNASDATTGYLKKALEDPARSVRAKARLALQSRGATDLPEFSEPPLSFSPYRELTFRKNPLVEIETNKGSFTVECFAKDAPIHVADFVAHVKAGFYDGLLWHRVVSNFVIQGGDPDGTGYGGAGYSLRAEVNPKLFLRGALGMPRSQGFDTGGSQLFFSHVPTPHLDGQYTVFGQIVSGLEVLDRIERGDRIVKARVVR